MKIGRIIAVTFSTVVLAFSALPAAVAAPPIQAPSGAHEVSTVTTHDSPSRGVEKKTEFSDGSTVTYGWRPIHHDALSDQKTAFGCNQDVCIDVQGSGLEVTKWNTQAFGNVGCTYPIYIKNGAWVHVGHDVCPTEEDDGVYYYYWSNPLGGNFVNHDELCNQWHSVLGKPCEEVYQD